MTTTKKSIKFAISDEAPSTSTDKKTYRKTQFADQQAQNGKTSISDTAFSFDTTVRSGSRRISSESIRQSIAPRYSTRITQMFSNINIRRDRQSIVLQPVETHLPTYRTESTKPFDPRIVEDYLKNVFENQLDNHGKFKFDDQNSMNALIRNWADQILFEVKSYEFDRYEIFVSLTICQKQYQGFNQSIGVLWDIEKDAMATYLYERGDVFAYAVVYGIYFD